MYEVVCLHRVYCPNFATPAKEAKSKKIHVFRDPTNPDISSESVNRYYNYISFCMLRAVVRQAVTSHKENPPWH